MLAKVRKAVFPQPVSAPIPSRYEGPSTGDAADRRQADHPVRRGGGDPIGDSEHHHRDRTRQGAIEDHFDVSFELEHLLETRHKKELLAIVAISAT